MNVGQTHILVDHPDCDNLRDIPPLPTVEVPDLDHGQLVCDDAFFPFH